MHFLTAIQTTLIMLHSEYTMNMGKTIAIASGKGGVGKTTTAVNLALYSARKGIATALLDIDPLANAAGVLALPEEKLASIPAQLSSTRPLKDYTVPVFRTFDLLFPLSKYSPAERNGFPEMLSGLLPSLKEQYEVLILDLPAGSDAEENLAFLSMADTLLLVTNPDPAAHVATGTYLKQAIARISSERIFFWHNRYRGFQSISFQASDVIGNYNRNMPEEECIDPQQVHVAHAAFIPDDTSLDLLQGEPAVLLQLLRNMYSTLDAIHETLLAEVSLELPFSSHLMELIRMFLRNYGTVNARENELLEEFGTYLRRILGAAAGENPDSAAPLFTEEQERILEDFFARALSNRTLRQLRKTITLVDAKREYEEERLSGFSNTGGSDHAKGLERELSALLLYLEEEARYNSSLKNHGGLLLFQFSLYKLFQSEKIRGVLEGFIPRSKNGGSRPRRDRYTQIARLIEGGEQYRREYIALIKKLFPLILRQVGLLSSTFELDDLLFANEGNKPDKKVYAHLTSSFVHEAINSGLGVMVSFNHRPASVAFERAAAALLSSQAL